MAYPKSEQETILVFEAESGLWSFYSTHPPSIRKYKDLLIDVKSTEDEYGINSIQGKLHEVNVTISKKRKMTDEQKAASAKRLAEARAKQTT